jgi:DNA-directed RNA polymerase beta' subunit
MYAYSVFSIFSDKPVFSWLAQGHFGFIKLPVSIYHPSHITGLTKILNMICFSCLQFKNYKV